MLGGVSILRLEMGVKWIRQGDEALLLQRGGATNQMKERSAEIDHLLVVTTAPNVLSVGEDPQLQTGTGGVALRGDVEAVQRKTEVKGMTRLEDVARKKEDETVVCVAEVLNYGKTRKLSKNLKVTQIHRKENLHPLGEIPVIRVVHQ